MLIKGLMFYAKISFGLGFFIFSYKALVLAMLALMVCRLSCVQNWQERYLLEPQPVFIYKDL